MTLEKYLHVKKMTPAQFARALRVPQSTVSRILNRKRRPSLQTYAKIKAATRGAVQMEDMLLGVPKSRVSRILRRKNGKRR